MAKCRLSLGTCAPNVKSAALIVLELLASNNQKKYGDQVTMAMPLSKFFMGHVGAVPRNTHRHTSNENSISAIHSIHLVEIFITILLLLSFCCHHYHQ